MMKYKRLHRVLKEHNFEESNEYSLDGSIYEKEFEMKNEEADLLVVVMRNQFERETVGEIHRTDVEEYDKASQLFITSRFDTDNVVSRHHVAQALEEAIQRNPKYSDFARAVKSYTKQIEEHL